MPKVGFVVRNKFQAHHFKNLVAGFPNADFLADSTQFKLLRPTSREPSFIDRPLISFDHYSIGSIARRYDAIVFQTVFSGIEAVEGPKMISVQYGLAKERHNYGAWRSLADLNLMYGAYSVEAVCHFSPAEPVGNLRFCGWKPATTQSEKQDAKIRLGFDPARLLLLYMPTYGALSSIDELLAPLSKLPKSIQLAVKIHHNDELQNPGRVRKVRRLDHIKLYFGDADQCALLDATDIVISDFSGAIFDAYYAGKPTIIYQSHADQKVGLQKFDLNSLEYKTRDTLGIPCDNVQCLLQLIAALMRGEQFKISTDPLLRGRLFTDVSAEASIAGALHSIERLLNAEYSLTKPQFYVRETVRKLLATERIPKFRRFLWGGK